MKPDFKIITFVAIEQEVNFGDYVPENMIRNIYRATYFTRTSSEVSVLTLYERYGTSSVVADQQGFKERGRVSLIGDRNLPLFRFRGSSIIRAMTSSTYGSGEIICTLTYADEYE